MATISSLAYEITANIDPIKNKLNQLALGFDDLSSRIKTVGKSIDGTVTTFSDTLAKVIGSVSTAVDKLRENFEELIAKIKIFSNCLPIPVAFREGFFSLLPAVGAVGKTIATLVAVSAGLWLFKNYAAVQAAFAVATTGGSIAAIKEAASLQYVSFTATLASVAVTKFVLVTGLLISQLTLFLGIPVFAAIIFGAEKGRREIAGLLEITTPLQDIFQKLTIISQRWFEAIGGPSLDLLVDGLTILTGVLESVRNGLDLIESVPGLGPVLKTCEGLIAPTTILIGLTYGLYAAYVAIGKITFLGKLVGVIKNLVIGTKSLRLAIQAITIAKKTENLVDATGIGLKTASASATTTRTIATGFFAVAAKIATVAQATWNVALIYFNVLIGVGIAFIVAAGIAAASYSASARNAAESSETAANAATNYSESLEKLSSDLDNYKNIVAQMNADALTPFENYAKKQQEVQALLETQAKAEEELALAKARRAEIELLIASRKTSVDDATKEELRGLQEQIPLIESKLKSLPKLTEAAKIAAEKKNKKDLISSLGLSDFFKNQETAEEAYRDQKSKLDLLLAERVIAQEEYNSALANAKKAWDEANPEIKRQKKELEEYNNSLANVRKLGRTQEQIYNDLFAEFNRVKSDLGSDEITRIKENLTKQFLGQSAGGNLLLQAVEASKTKEERLAERIKEIETTAAISGITNESVLAKAKELAEKEIFKKDSGQTKKNDLAAITRGTTAAVEAQNKAGLDPALDAQKKTEKNTEEMVILLRDIKNSSKTKNSESPEIFYA